MARFPVTATSGLVSNASAVATVTGVTGKMTYITQLGIQPGTATASVPITATLTGAGTVTFGLTVPTTAVGGDPASGSMTVNFVPPLPAAAVAGNVVLTLPATGSGGVNAQTTLIGYQE